MIRSLLVALAFGVAIPAAADEPGAWTDPDRIFSVDLAANGWQMADRAAHPDWFSDGSLFLAYSGMEGAHPRNICSAKIENRRQMIGDTRREHLNEVTRQLLNSPTIDEMRHNPQFRPARIDVVEIDDVSVLETDGAFMSLDTLTHRFLMYQRGELRLYALQCSVDGGDARAIAESHAFAASLHFLGTGATP